MAMYDFKVTIKHVVTGSSATERKLGKTEEDVMKLIENFVSSLIELRRNDEADDRTDLEESRAEFRNSSH